MFWLVLSALLWGMCLSAQPPTSMNGTLAAANVTMADVYRAACAADDQEACDDGRQCVAKSRMCDGNVDCADGSDEDRRICAPEADADFSATVSVEKCGDAWFFCRDASACVHPLHVCDGLPNCRSDYHI